MTWRQKLKAWLAQVAQQARYNRNWEFAARQMQASFPPSLFVKVLRVVFQWAAKQVVQSALRDAGTELGLNMSDLELNVLTDVAVSLA